MKRWYVPFGAVLLVLAFASLAFAHAEITSCTPAIGSTLAEPPGQLVCKATEGLDSDGSSLAVYDAAGSQVDKGDSKLDLNDPDRKIIMVSLDRAKLTPGVYTVKWVTVSDEDGDKDEGEFTFTVGSANVQPTMDHAHGSATETHSHGAAIGTLEAFDGKIMIVSPANCGEVAAGEVAIKVMTENAPLGSDYHWHLTVDGGPIDMVMGGLDQKTIQLTPGKHVLRAVLSDGMHNELISDTITVMAVTGMTMTMGTPTATGMLTPTMAMTATTAPMQMGTPVTGTVEASDGKLRIVSPANCSEVAAGEVTVKVMTENAPLGSSYHWHLTVDGGPIDMVMGGLDQKTVQLAPGKHILRAVLSDGLHNELTSDTITVMAATGTPPPVHADGAGTPVPVMTGTATPMPTSPTAVPTSS